METPGDFFLYSIFPCMAYGERWQQPSPLKPPLVLSPRATPAMSAAPAHARAPRGSRDHAPFTRSRMSRKTCGTSHFRYSKSSIFDCILVSFKINCFKEVYFYPLKVTLQTFVTCYNRRHRAFLNCTVG